MEVLFIYFIFGPCLPKWKPKTVPSFFIMGKICLRRPFILSIYEGWIKIHGCNTIIVFTSLNSVLSFGVRVQEVLVSVFFLNFRIVYLRLSYVFPIIYWFTPNRVLIFTELLVNYVNWCNLSFFRFDILLEFS